MLEINFIIIILFLSASCFANISTSHNKAENAIIESSGDTAVDILNEFTTLATIPTTEKPKRTKISCSYYGGKKSHIDNRKYEILCCRKIWENYKARWHNGGKYITSILETMKAWNCTEFFKECKNPTFYFSDFTKLAYEKFCDPMKYRKQCKDDIEETYKKQNHGYYANDWTELTFNLSSKNLSNDELRKPCVQLGLFESRHSGVGYYHETIDIVPFCGFVWCGYDSESLDNRGIASWMCMPDRCRAGIAISILICVILAIAIVLANITVIVVFYTYKNMRNSQAVYKISLAVADLLVGAIVFPTFISSLQKMFMVNHTMGEFVSDFESNDLIMDTMSLTGQTLAPRKPGGYFSKRLAQSYLNFVGIFTSVSLLVSVYTLMMASFDRLLAVSMPMTYSRHNAKNMALWTTGILWVLAIVFSLLPLFIEDLKYGLIASIIITSSGPRAVILFSVAFAVPLAFVWITTVATYLSTKKHAKARRRLTVNSRKKGESLEKRLAKTLAIMVGVFTLTLLPTAIVLITSIFLTNIDYNSLDTFDPQAATAFVSCEFVFSLVLMTNSLWNCFIYNARSKEFKIAARGMYRRMLIRMGFRTLWNQTRLLTSRGRSTRTTSMSMSTTIGYRKRSTVATLQTNFQSTDSVDGLDKSDRKFSTQNSASNLFDKAPQRYYSRGESQIEMKPTPE